VRFARYDAVDVKRVLKTVLIAVSFLVRNSLASGNASRLPKRKQLSRE